jgi:hypothetical protein
MMLVPLTQGKFAQVDASDWPAVMRFKWHVKRMRRGLYAARNVHRPGGGQRTRLLHQDILPGVSQVDHRDGNGLNNRRKNLRTATTRQNRQGFQRKKKGTSSHFRGVCWKAQVAKWRAQIQVDGDVKHLGYFSREVDAAKAYDTAARCYFGNFASPNFP